MHFACIFGREDVLQLLLNRAGEASLEARDTLGFSPLMCAVEGGHVGCVERMVGRADLETRDGQGGGLEERAR